MLPLFLLWAVSAHAQITVYHQTVAAVPTTSALAPGATVKAAYDPTVLNGPTPPTNLNTVFSLQLQTTAAAQQGLSIPQSGTFFGFSIETSVVNQVIGINASRIKPPFLNLMSNIITRAGAVHIRVGGNTQEDATLVPSLPDGKMIEKNTGNSTSPTQTPALLYTPELIYMLANVSSLLNNNVKWYLGLPFNDTTNLRLGIAELGQAFLGDNLLGLQAGNEPDLYSGHGRRPPGYTAQDYYNEIGTLVTALAADPKIPNKDMLIAPSVASGPSGWPPENVWNTGFADTYATDCYAFAVEHYPNNNCAALYGTATFGPVVVPQDAIGEFLNHTLVVQLVQPYVNSANIAKSHNKPFIMFETNTGSCGGFAGISSSLTAAFWAIDYGLQMASVGFTGANVHVGGQNVYYNPFTAPPSNETYHQWTIGGIFYAHLVVSEAFGSTGTAQIVDLNANYGEDQTPAYAIYENGVPARVVIINYVDDATGKNDLTVNINIGGGQTNTPNSVPATVRVKYLTAPGIGNKANITWAGQGFGGDYESNGILAGNETITTITCDQTTNTCTIPVHAPAIALVFLNDEAFQKSEPTGTVTFATSTLTQKHGTLTVNPSVLATSNGHSGNTRQSGSTSKGTVGGAVSSHQVSIVLLIAGACLSAALVL
jgi:hypothetical protein